MESKIMKEVYVEDTSKGAFLRDVPIPKPGPKEVLVKMIAATIMPLDRMMSSTQVFPTPYVLGPQGSGVIAEVGEGIDTKLIGKKALLYSSLLLLPQRKWQGLWSQYIVRKLDDVFIFNQAISHEQACGMYGNPLTAMGVMRVIEKGKYKTTILSAACSEICKKVAMMHREKGIPLINLVRGPENVKILKELGETLIVDIKDPGYEGNLKPLIEKYEPNVFIDSVVDSISQKVFELMPPKSTIILFGGLGGQSTFPVNSFDVVLNEKIVTGYYWSLEDYKKPKEDILKELAIVDEDLAKGGKRFGVKIVGDFKLEDFKTALKEQAILGSKGRCILRLNPE